MKMKDIYSLAEQNQVFSDEAINNAITTPATMVYSLPHNGRLITSIMLAIGVASKLNRSGKNSDVTLISTAYRTHAECVADTAHFIDSPTAILIVEEEYVTPISAFVDKLPDETVVIVARNMKAGEDAMVSPVAMYSSIEDGGLRVDYYSGETDNHVTSFTVDADYLRDVGQLIIDSPDIDK